MLETFREMLNVQIKSKHIDTSTILFETTTTTMAMAAAASAAMVTVTTKKQTKTKLNVLLRHSSEERILNGEAVSTCKSKTTCEFPPKSKVKVDVWWMLYMSSSSRIFFFSIFRSKYKFYSTERSTATSKCSRENPVTTTFAVTWAIIPATAYIVIAGVWCRFNSIFRAAQESETCEKYVVCGTYFHRTRAGILSFLSALHWADVNFVDFFFLEEKYHDN